MIRKLFKEDDNYKSYFTSLIIWAVFAGLSAGYIISIIKDLIQILN